MLHHRREIPPFFLHHFVQMHLPQDNRIQHQLQHRQQRHQVHLRQPSRGRPNLLGKDYDAIPLASAKQQH